jgi:predicted nucleotidyltransferase
VDAKQPAAVDVWAQRDARRAGAQRSAVAEVEQVLPRAVEILRAHGCTEIWLAGSFAHDAPHASSDVDLLVRGLPVDRRGEAVDALEHLFRRSVDLAELERIPAERLSLALHGARRLFP